MNYKGFLLAAMCVCCALPSAAQFRHAPTPNDTLRSTRVLPNGDVIFSIYAPEAGNVQITGDCVPWGKDFKLIKNDQGVWSTKIVGVKDGAYRYNFVIDGVTTIDPKAPATNEQRSILKVENDPDAFFALKDVPHGAVAQRYYYSTTLKRMERMHVWTPAGYEKSSDNLPVFYLIHGGGDNDAAWPTVGRAGLILDNLLAKGQIVPMVVVMPNGSIDTPDGNVHSEVPLFAKEMIADIIPFIEANYRVLTDRDHRAIGGLSMGGMETMETALYNADMFAYVYVLSSSFSPGDEKKYEAERVHLRKDADIINKNVKQLVFTQGGPEDIAYNNCKKTLKLFDEAGIKYEYCEAPGGHSWYTWRNNLYDLAPRLFK